MFEVIFFGSFKILDSDLKENTLEARKNVFYFTSNNVGFKKKINKEKHLEISLFYTFVPKIFMM